jgi:predicted ABC-type ATPase
MAKWMVIIAGPNGAGKSSITNAVLSNFNQESFIKFNADERTIELRNTHPGKTLPEMNLLAAQQIDAEVANSIKAGQSFYVETVLSSPKYRDDVLEAKACGFKFALIYVSLFPPELSPQRIKLRVKEGGHDVETSKALARYRPSHEQLRWFAEQADTFLIFDNSALDKNPILLAAKLAGREIAHHAKGINPEVDRVVSDLKKGQSSNPAPTNG